MLNLVILSEDAPRLKRCARSFNSVQHSKERENSGRINQHAISDCLRTRAFADDFAKQFARWHVIGIVAVWVV